MSIASVVILTVATGVPPQSSWDESAFAAAIGVESVSVTNPLLSSYSTWYGMTSMPLSTSKLPLLPDAVIV